MAMLSLPDNKNFNNYRNIKLQILAILTKTILTIKIGPMGPILIGSISLVWFKML